ncbi:MAG: MBL fold metallo-hydrolase [Eubacteriales bacterium]|nr:MBL fold metallo-hydrolase [Eubacteriales bacterium]
MTLQVVATGSTGNCYILWHEGRALVLDAGVKAKRIVQAVGYDPSLIDACLITHEHGDHSLAVADLDRIGVPCYGTEGTARLVPGLIHGHYIKDRIRAIGHLLVMDFPIHHDAVEPCGYLITNTKTGERMMYATDTYYLSHQFPGIHYWLIECNYMQSLLDENTPHYLARRLNESHMSLERLCELFKANDLTACQQIILCHASQGRADKVVMVDTIAQVTHKPVDIAVAGARFYLSPTPF